MKLDVLAFGAHPDDIELGCGGTVAKMTAEGRKVGVIDLTGGELGTRGSKELRKKESGKAAEILNLSIRENLEFADGFFTNDKEHQLKIIKKIRKYRPDIVLANAVDDRHIDHPKGSNLVSDACFLSGLEKIQTIDEGEIQTRWRPKVVYHYIQWKNLTPDFIVDISDYIRVKEEAVKAYASQFYDPDSKELETPITSKNFIDSIAYRARDLGRMANIEAAEGFTVERFITVDSLFDIK